MNLVVFCLAERCELLFIQVVDYFEPFYQEIGPIFSRFFIEVKDVLYPECEIDYL